ncbi:unnamed protein product [Durusdinium trenchii]|uniref:Protoporphyrinogen oxidase n=1 Tax=Durusdinium trenchii TaxID=1381693 RepID=A0ABP0MKE2_9DINO
MVRCVIGLGGPLSSQFPLVRAHVGRAFVEHVAETQSFGAWRSNSVALADFAEHGSGVVLVRLWADCTKETVQASVAAKQALKYLGVRSPEHFVLAHAETRKACGRFLCGEGNHLAPAWAKPIIDAVAPEFRPGRKAIEQPLRIIFGANAVLQSAFPAAFEWLLKRWFGPDAVTDGAVLRRRLAQDVRRKELGLEEQRIKAGR